MQAVWCHEGAVAHTGRAFPLEPMLPAFEKLRDRPSNVSALQASSHRSLCSTFLRKRLLDPVRSTPSLQSSTRTSHFNHGESGACSGACFYSNAHQRAATLTLAVVRPRNRPPRGVGDTPFQQQEPPLLLPPCDQGLAMGATSGNRPGQAEGIHGKVP
jgi:hypothetical protein